MHCLKSGCGNRKGILRKLRSLRFKNTFSPTKVKIRWYLVVGVENVNDLVEFFIGLYIGMTLRCVMFTKKDNQSK